MTLNTEHEGADHVVNREGTLHAVDDTAGLAAQPVEEGEDPKSPK